MGELMASNQAVQAIECNINLQSECAGSFAFMPSGTPFTTPNTGFHPCVDRKALPTLLVRARIETTLRPLYYYFKNNISYSYDDQKKVSIDLFLKKTKKYHNQLITNC